MSGPGSRVSRVKRSSRTRPAKQKKSSPATVQRHLVFGYFSPVNSKKWLAGARQRPWVKRRFSERKLITGPALGLGGGKPHRSQSSRTPSSKARTPRAG